MPELRPNVTVNVSPTTNESNLTNISILQPNAFKLSISRKHFPNLEFFCQSVLHPEVSATPAELPFKRVANIPFAADKLNFGELTCMIILDENLNSYTEMYNWVNRITQQSNVTPTMGTNAIPPSEADITLSILSSHNNVTRQVVYHDCIPTGLGLVQFEATSGADQYIVYPATFRYSYFEFK
jgi:hypothetical protein